jgi:integrase
MSAKAPRGLVLNHGERCSYKGWTTRCPCGVKAWISNPQEKGGKEWAKPPFKGKGKVAAAKAWRRDAELKRDMLLRGELNAPMKKTLNEAWDEVLQREAEGKLKKKDYGESTYKGYRSFWRNHIGPSVGDMDWNPKAPGGFRKRHAQDLVYELEAKELGAGTVIKALVPLRVIYREAFKNEDLSDNPLLGLDLPEDPPKDTVALTDEEMRAYLDALPISVPYKFRGKQEVLYCRIVYEIMARAGMRVGEVRGLRRADVHLHERLFYLCGQWPARGSHWVPNTKFGKENVVYLIPISDDLYPGLNEHMERLGWDDGYLCGRNASTPFAYSTLCHQASKAWGPAGLESVNTHLYRHSCASKLYRDTGRIDLVQGLLRHSDPATTRGYIHATSNTVNEIAAGLNAGALKPAPVSHQLGPGTGGNRGT